MGFEEGQEKGLRKENAKSMFEGKLDPGQQVIYKKKQHVQKLTYHLPCKTH